MKKTLLWTCLVLCLGVPAAFGQEDPDLSTALRHYFRREYPAAVEAFQKVIAEDPNNAAAYYYLGYTYQEMGNYPAAREAFTKTYEINPDYVPTVPDR